MQENLRLIADKSYEEEMRKISEKIENEIEELQEVYAVIARKRDKMMEKFQDRGKGLKRKRRVLD
jgi:hypothetical protein